ncbi:MAG: ubiquitin-like small modifier protein 1 [Candidatus Bathyarchaeia archaeon]
MASSTRVTVRFFATLRELTGKQEEQLDVTEPASVKVVLDELTKRYGKPFKTYIFNQGQLSDRLQIFVDGKNITSLEGLGTRMKDGGTLAILPPAGGGRSSAADKYQFEASGTSPIIFSKRA